MRTTGEVAVTYRAHRSSYICNSIRCNSGTARSKNEVNIIKSKLKKEKKTRKKKKKFLKTIKSSTVKIRLSVQSSHSTIHFLVKLLVSVSGFQWIWYISSSCSTYWELRGSFGILSLWFSNFSLLSAFRQENERKIWMSQYIFVTIYNLWKSMAEHRADNMDI